MELHRVNPGKVVIAMNIRSKEKGYALVITLFLLAMLTVIGIAATRTSMVESQISGNNKAMVQEFYVVEGALVSALERTDWWLSAEFLKTGPVLAYWSDDVDIDGDNKDDALVEVRCVEPNKAVVDELSPEANDIPADRHTGPPPIGSGYSARHFYVRKFALTATGLRSGVKLQTGAWKVFNKF